HGLRFSILWPSDVYSRLINGSFEEGDCTVQPGMKGSRGKVAMGYGVSGETKAYLSLAALLSLLC
ncbi:mCG1028104, partial [Mus musculus]